MTLHGLCPGVQPVSLSSETACRSAFPDLFETQATLLAHLLHHPDRNPRQRRRSRVRTQDTCGRRNQCETTRPNARPTFFLEGGPLSSPKVLTPTWRIRNITFSLIPCSGTTVLPALARRLMKLPARSFLPSQRGRISDGMRYLHQSASSPQSPPRYPPHR